MERRYYEKAGVLGLESRSEVIERMKKGKELYEKRQTMLKKIDQILQKTK